MLAQAHTFTLQRQQARHVLVELDVRPGLPAFTIVGLADAAVREARERIQTAIRNSGLEFPTRRITANLAPGDMPKAGAGLDLAIACAILAATGQVEPELLRDTALFGELALDGRVRAVQGTLAAANGARACGLRRLALARTSAHEAGLIEPLELAPVADLNSVVRVLRGGSPDAPLRPASTERRERTAPRPDLSEVRGQAHAARALVVAAAGAHSILLSGPPGTGKTMLARRLPSILPPLEREEEIEARLIADAARMRREGALSERPFRAPHHSITAAGLIGGAGGSLGEVVRAHRGVLFLDELSEFTRPALEALRQPLEDGQVTVVRAGQASLHQTRFLLIAASNPCPCGYASEPERCRCTPGELARHKRRLSGALLDRIDMQAVLSPQSGDEPAAMSSAEARELVVAARARQTRRLAGSGVSLNSQLDAGQLRRHLSLEGDGERLLKGARAAGLLSARGEQRVLRVALTLADLDASARVRGRDVGAALALRCGATAGAPRR